MRRWMVTSLLVAGCEARLMGVSTDAGGSAQRDGGNVTATDGAIDAFVLGAWGSPTRVAGASTANVSEDDATLSSTALELIFKRVDAGDVNLYVMTRASTSAAWSAPTALGVLNTTSAEESPRLSDDDLTLYFGRSGDIFMSTRGAVGGAWGTPVAVTALNTAAYEKWADVCSTGYAIVSRDNGATGQDLYEGTISGGAATLLSGLSSPGADQGTFLSNDCLDVYFQSNRDNGQFDIYLASRASTSAAWGAPAKLVDFNSTTADEEDPWIAPDERTFVYASTATGDKDVYITTR